MQRIRHYAHGQSVVVYAEDIEIADHREYEDAIASFQTNLPDGCSIRTVAEGAPLYQRSYIPEEEDVA